MKREKVLAFGFDYDSDNHYLKSELIHLVKNDERILDFIHEEWTDGISYWNIKNGKDEWISHRFWSLLGYEPNEKPHLLSSWQEVIFEEDFEHIWLELERFLKNPKGQFSFKARHKHKNGSTKWFVYRGHLINDEDDKPYRMLGAIQDITREKEQEIKLKESEHLFRILFEQSPIGIARVSPQGQMVQVNNKFAEILGYSNDELLKMNTNDITYHEDIDPCNAQFNKLVIGEREEINLEKRMVRKTGEVLWVRLNVKAIKGGNEIVTDCIANVLDITKEKQAQLKLIESEERFRGIFKDANFGIALGTIDGRIIDANYEFTKSTGYSLEELKSTSSSEVTHPDDQKENYKLLEELLANKRDSFRYEKRLKTKQGEYRWFDTFVVARRNDFGEIYNLILTAVDIHEKKIASSKLQDQKDFLQLLIDNMPNQIFWKDVDLNYVGCNKTFAKIVGLDDEDDVKGLSDYDFNRSNEHVEHYLNIDKKVIESGKPSLGIEEMFNTSSDEQGYVLTSKVPIKNGSNEVEGVLGICVDITAQKEHENQLREQKEFLQLLMNNMPNMIFWKDINSNYLGCNKTFAEVVGLKHPNEVVGLSDFDLSWNQEQIKQYQVIDKKIIKSGQSFLDMEESYTSVTGKGGFVLTSKMPLKGEDGNVSGVLGICVDITERKKVMDTLRESEHKYKNLFEESTDAVIITTRDAIIIDLNKKALNLFGYDMEYLMGKSLLDFHPPEELPTLKKIIENAEKELGSPINFNTKYVNSKKEIIEVRIYSKVVDKEKGIVQSIVKNITERKKYINALEESEHKYRTLYEESKDAVFLINKDGCFSHANNQALKLLGYEMGEIVGMHVTALHLPEEVELARSKFVNDLKSSGALEFESVLVHKSGEQIDVDIFARVYDKERGFVQAIVRDITQQKRNALLIKQSEERFGLAIEGANLGTWDWNLLTGEVYTNEYWINLQGYKVEEIEPTIRWWRSLIHQDDIKKIDKLMNEHRAGKSEMYDAEFRVKDKSGNYRLINDIGKVSERDEEGDPIRFSGIHVDITERKKVEKELITAKEKAEEANRLKTEFLHNMSHEIRTPMNGIMGFADLLAEEDLNKEQQKNFTTIIRNSSTQLLRIIDDILEISTLDTKQVRVQFERFNLNDFMMELFSVFDLKARSRALPLYVKKGLDDSKSDILSDRTKLYKIMENLLENALKFTKTGFVEFGYYIEEEFLIYYVKDTGIGISDKNKKQIFDRFSQEDGDISRDFGGLGLGLAISKENAKLLQGRIVLESEKGVGSIFSVVLPYNSEEEPKNTPETEDSHYVGENLKTYNLLVAEDEEVNYYIIETYLSRSKKANFNLVHAKNGQEAIELCNEDIQLVLMDIKMPILNGYDATKKIKELFPDLPIIAQTAFSTDADKKMAFDAGCVDFISKPLGKNHLVEMILNYLEK